MKDLIAATVLFNDLLSIMGDLGGGSKLSSLVLCYYG
jgi:hypothetical protein